MIVYCGAKTSFVKHRCRIISIIFPVIAYFILLEVNSATQSNLNEMKLILKVHVIVCSKHNMYIILSVRLCSTYLPPSWRFPRPNFCISLALLRTSLAFNLTPRPECCAIYWATTYNFKNKNVNDTKIVASPFNFKFIVSRRIHNLL